MLAATILTLALVPVFYVVIEKMRERSPRHESASAQEALEAHAGAAE